MPDSTHASPLPSALTTPSRHLRRWLIPLAVTAVLPACACSAPTPGTATPSATPSGSAAVSAPGGGPVTAHPAISAAIDALPGDLPQRVGLAAVPVGPPHPPALHWGTVQTGPAWSTIKVPLAVAAKGREPEAVNRALSQSDNAAAATIWAALGGGETAAGTVQTELRAGGDRTTTVEHAEVRPPYTPYGQTTWTLADSAQYAASLPCRREADSVYSAMHSVVPEQRWGLGTIGSEAYKGGWGPGKESGFVVRQIGILAHPDGSKVAVSLIAVGHDYATTSADLNLLAGIVKDHLHVLPGGRC